MLSGERAGSIVGEEEEEMMSSAGCQGQVSRIPGENRQTERQTDGMREQDDDLSGSPNLGGRHADWGDRGGTCLR